VTRVTGDWLTRDATQAVCAMLTEAGYQALLVGGCVRNALLGFPVDDIDIATDAVPERVVELAEAAGLKPVPTGIDHGTITVVADHIGHEITTFRRDVETFGRHATVAFSTDVREDAARRDFTMNALYAQADGTVIDPLGGLHDLHARRVRFVGDPVDRIREDYLRSLRFFRFSAWYGDPAQGMDAEGLAAIAAHLEGLGALSRERVGGELKKLLKAPDPAPAVGAMAQTGVLAALVPGAIATPLAPLVHLEGAWGLAPDPIRRLAALIGTDDAQDLRLSKAEMARLTALRDGATGTAGAAELGYRLGHDQAESALLLRAALFDTPPPPDARDAARRGAQSTFPVRARDLMPDLEGPELGARLTELEARWIASGFTLSKRQLLD